MNQISHLHTIAGTEIGITVMPNGFLILYIEDTTRLVINLKSFRQALEYAEKTATIRKQRKVVAQLGRPTISQNNPAKAARARELLAAGKTTWQTRQIMVRLDKIPIGHDTIKRIKSAMDAEAPQEAA